MSDYTYPHVQRMGATFCDRKGRLVNYVICYSGIKEAKTWLKLLKSEGFPVRYMVKYSRVASEEPSRIKPKPAYLIFTTKSRVLLSLHRNWFTDPEVVWRNK